MATTFVPVQMPPAEDEPAAICIERNIVGKLHGPAFLHLMDEELATPFGREKVTRESEALKQLPVMTAPSRWTLSQPLARYELTRLWDLVQCGRNALVFIGPFDEVKGAEVLIQAFNRLLVDRPNLKLIFVGPDWGFVNGGSWSFQDYRGIPRRSLAPAQLDVPRGSRCGGGRVSSHHGCVDDRSISSGEPGLHSAGSDTAGLSCSVRMPRGLRSWSMAPPGSRLESGIRTTFQRRWEESRGSHVRTIARPGSARFRAETPLHQVQSADKRSTSTIGAWR